MVIERNWAGNLAYRTSGVLHPRTPDELRGMLARGGAVRMLGSRHCFNDIADSDGPLIALGDMPRTFEISPERDAVRVAGGLRYGDIAPLLHAEGLALANMASLPHISVAGSVATGTHGSGDDTGSLASAVRELTVVTPAGDVRSLRRGDADFDGAVVGLGALGAVTELTLDVEPTYDVAQYVFESPEWDGILEHFDEVTAVGTSVSIFSTWHRTDVADQAWVKQRLPDTGEARRADLFERLRARAATSHRHPIFGADALACTEQLGAPGPWHERLPHFKLEFTPSAGAEIQSEYLVPRADAVAAIQAVRRLAGDIAPLVLVSEIRTVAADQLWLSPSSQTDSVGIHFTWQPDERRVRAFLPTLEAALPRTARPHWGKVFAFSGGEVRPRYPRFDDFIELARGFDPQRRLVNPYLERLGL